MSTATLRRHWVPSNESRPLISRPAPKSPKMQVHDARIEAAAFMNRMVPPRRTLSGVSSQKLSVARRDGGGIGDVAQLMIRDPKNAMAYAEYLLAVARGVVRANVRPLRIVLHDEIRADADEDIAQSDLMAEETVENLRRFIDSETVAIARAQEALDAAKVRLAELEAER